MKEAYDNLEQRIEEFIEMNGSDTINLREIGVVWYLRGLGDDHANFQSNLMTSNETLTKKYVLNQVNDLMELN